VYGGLIDKFPIGAAFAKGLTLKMGQTHVHKYMRPLLERICRGDIDPSFIISHKTTLDEAPDAYRMFLEKTDGLHEGRDEAMNRSTNSLNRWILPKPISAVGAVYDRAYFR